MKWQYIYLAYDANQESERTKNSSLPLNESLKLNLQNALEQKTIMVHLPDGGAEMIKVNPLLVEREILSILNHYGSLGWEAFYCSREDNGQKIQWALKRPFS